MAFVGAVRVRAPVTPQWHIAQSFGFSNSARFIDGGLLLGVINMERFRQSYNGTTQGMAFCSVIDASPDDHVYLAVLIDAGEVARLHSRLVEQGGRSNNVRINLLGSGRIYIDSVEFHPTLREEHGFRIEEGTALLAVNRIVYAVYPPTTTAHRSLMAGQLVGYLADVVGRDRVEEIQPWDEDELALGPQMRRMPLTIPLPEIRTGIERLGGYYIDDLVERFHLSLNYLPRKHFVILSGLSGTGKTSLALRYAAAVHGVEDTGATSPLTFICPVRPDWTDSTGLLGYYDVISDRYVVPRFLEALIAAITHRDSPVFVILDELNNARVEYYFAEMLSVMEANTRIELHAHATALPGTTGGEIPNSIPLPANLFVVGTINVDESTQPISDKVLDRATVIDMSNVSIGGYCAHLERTYPGLADATAACRPLLVRLSEILTREGLGFGYRVTEEVIRYVDTASRHGARDPNDVLDDQLTQKVLVKLRGDERHRAMLTQLGTELGGFRRSVATVVRLIEELDEYGSFQSLR